MRILVGASPGGSTDTLSRAVGAEMGRLLGRQAIVENRAGAGGNLAADLVAMWRWFPVISRNSSFTFKGRAVDIKEVGRSLGARYVLEGGVRKAGDRIRVTGQLIDAQTGHHLWAEGYDRKLDNFFDIQDELTDSIAAALEAAVGRSEAERVRVKPPSNLYAWEMWQRGWWHLMYPTREDLSAAETFFLHAIELDGRMAQPHCGLAWLRLMEGFLGWAPPQVSFPEGIRHAQAAMAIDPLEPVSYGAASAILAFSKKLDDALAMGKRSVALNPSGIYAFLGLGLTHLFRGEAGDGIAAGETAIRLSPNDQMLYVILGTLSANYYMARDYLRSIEIAKLAIQRAPNYIVGWRSLANGYGQLGRIDEAREALAKFLELAPAHSTEVAARQIYGFQDEGLIQFYCEGLRKAGWKG